MNNNQFLDAKSASELLCIKLSTLYSWISYKQIPQNIYRKLGRKPIFIKEELVKWFMDGAELSKRPTK